MSVVCKMVKGYLRIVDVSVYDMVPKYIILGLVQEVAPLYSIGLYHPLDGATNLK
jgi:hypothetical protein